MKKVLVTGANRGIGKQISLDLLALGCKVYAGARDIAKLKEAFPEKSDLLYFIEIDVTDESTVEKAASKISALDVVINNAGVGVGETDLAEANLEEVKRIFEVNFFGPMLVNKHFIPHLKNSADGIKVNSMCPGWVKSDMGGAGAPRTVQQGADTAVVLATSSNI